MHFLLKIRDFPASHVSFQGGTTLHSGGSFKVPPWVQTQLRCIIVGSEPLAHGEQVTYLFMQIWKKGFHHSAITWIRVKLWKWWFLNYFVSFHKKLRKHYPIWRNTGKNTGLKPPARKTWSNRIIILTYTRILASLISSTSSGKENTPQERDWAYLGAFAHDPWGPGMQLLWHKGFGCLFGGLC